MGKGKKREKESKVPKMLAVYKADQAAQREKKERPMRRGPSTIKPKTKHIDHGDDKRAINYTIQKNKGLTVHRKKEDRNPRVKLRNKFSKAKKRRKGQVREVHAEQQFSSNAYEGETSGINRNVVRSRKLN